MRLWALRAALQIPHFANALVRDDNPMSCGAALVQADEASIPRWFEVAGGNLEARQCSNMDGRGRPSSHRSIFKIADGRVRTGAEQIGRASCRERVRKLG